MINWNKVIVASDDDTVQVVCGKSIFFAVSRVSGIDRVQKTSTSGLVDLYTMYRTDGTVAGTFTVTNGRVAEIHICSSNEYDAQTLIPTVANPNENTFYLVPSGTGNDMYDEWIYVNGKWEKFGSASIDLSNYATKSELEEYATKSELEEEVYFENEYESVNGLLDIKDSSSAQTIKEAIYTYPPSLTGISWFEVMILNKNLINNQNPYIYPATQNGVTFTVNDDGSISFSGTPTAEIDISSNLSTYTLPIGQYTFSGGVSEDCYIYIYGSTLKSTGGDIPVQINANTSISVYIHINNTGTPVSGIFYPMFRLRSSIDDTYIKPLSSNSMFADFGSSRLYGGYYDFVNAKRCITHKHIDSYNGEPLPGAWISDRDTYAEGTLPSTGASVTYELAEPEIEETTKTKWNKTLLDGETVILLNYLNAKINISLDKISIKDTVLELKNSKQDTLTFDTTPTANSTNPVTSGGIKTVLDSKANTSDLGTMAFEDDAPSDNVEYVRKNGEWAISSGGGGSGGQTVWGAIAGTLSQQTDLQNALNGKADQSSTYTKTEVNNLLDGKQDELTFDNVPTENSDNPVKSSGIKTALDTKANTADLGDLATQDSADFETQVTNKPSAYPPAAHNHDDRYYTETEVDTFVDDLQDQIDNINSFAIHICSSTEYDETTHIPTVTNPNETTFYLVPNGTGNDVYDEYIYTNNTWEKFGSTRIDLSQYYTKTQTDELLNDLISSKQDTLTFDTAPIANSDNPVKSSGIKTALDGKADTTSVYTKTETDNLLNSKQNSLTFDNAPTSNSDNPVKSGGIKTALDTKADASSVYTKNEADALLVNKANTADLGDLATQNSVDFDTQVTGKPSAYPPTSHNHDDRYYTETEVDTFLNAKQNSLTFDTTPTANSTNPVQSGGIKTALDAKVDANGVYTKSETDALIDGLQDQIDDINNFTIHICTSTEYDSATHIPTVTNPNENTFYLVPNGTGNDVYDEWIYTNNAWEKFGSARIDLTQYYTKTQTDELLSEKANESIIADEWNITKAYSKDDIIIYNHELYKFTENVTSKFEQIPVVEIDTTYYKDEFFTYSNAVYKVLIGYIEYYYSISDASIRDSLKDGQIEIVNVKEYISGETYQVGDVVKIDDKYYVVTINGAGWNPAVVSKINIDNLLDGKQDTLTFDNVPTANSTNPVTSGGVYTAIANSGGGSGGGASAWGQITGTLSQQTDLQTALNNKQDILTFDSTPTANSSNPVTSDGIKSALNEKADISSLGLLASKDTISFTDIALPQNELQTFYVSPNGNNSNDGSRDYPFASIQRAVDTASPLALCRIYLYPGTYTHAFNVRNRTIIFYVLVDKDKQILIDPDVIIHGSGSSTFNSKRWSVYIGSNANVTIANGIWKIDGYTSSSTITIDGVVCVDNGTLLTKSAVSTFGTNDQPTLINSEVRIFDENDQSMINVINGGKLISNSKLTLNTSHDSEGIYVETGGNAFINQIAVEGNFDSTNNFMKSDCGIITYGSTNYTSFITKSNGGQIFTGN